MRVGAPPVPGWAKARAGVRARPATAIAATRKVRAVSVVRMVHLVRFSGGEIFHLIPLNVGKGDAPAQSRE